MGRFEKFLFDTSFDKEQTAKAKAAAAAHAVAEEPPAPTFSEEELTAARQAALAEGKAAGIAEAESCHAARLAAAVELLPPQLAQVAQDVAAEADARRRDSLEAALTVVRKLFPQLARAHGLDEVHAVIEQCLERLRDEPRVVIRCADADLDALRERAEHAAARSGFDGKLVFLADERLASGDLRVEWADGGAERDQARLWHEIDAVIARALTPAGEADKDKPSAGNARQATQPAPPKPAAPHTKPRPGDANPTPRADKPAAVQPLRRAQSA
jgi:flagellar assembly protein FliH